MRHGKPAKKRLSHILPVAFTEDDHQAITKAAAARHMTLNGLIRQIVLTAIEPKPIITPTQENAGADQPA